MNNAVRPEQAGTAPARPHPDGRSRREARRILLPLTLALWGANYLLLTMRSLVDGQPQAAELAVVRAGVTLVGIGFCWLIHRVLTRAAGRPVWQQLVVAVAATLIAAECFAWVNVFFAELVLVAPPRDPSTGTILFNLAYWVWFFLAWGAAYLAVAHAVGVADRDRRLAALRAHAQEARLTALRYQVNPHFLFNTLNAISALILDGRASDAEEMVARLAGFFRATLAVDPVASTRLDAEIALQRAYLAVEQVRFPDMRVEFALGEGTPAAAVPPLILQPLVENALKHGVARSPAATTVRVSARRQGDALCLLVEDDGSRAVAPPQRGVGLANVSARLAALYGDAARLTAGPGPAGGFRVAITMPFAVLA